MDSHGAGITMELLNLKAYVPEDKPFGENASYFVDDTGLDWYENNRKFKKKYKVAIISSTGVVRAVSSDVTELPIAGCDIREFDSIPDMLTRITSDSGEYCELVMLGEWKYTKGKFVKDPQYKIIKANAKKDDLISYALKKMKPLEFAEDLNISLGAVGPTLNDWKSYVIKLYETDTSTDEIEWPLKPE